MPCSTMEPSRAFSAPTCFMRQLSYRRLMLVISTSWLTAASLWQFEHLCIPSGPLLLKFSQQDKLRNRLYPSNLGYGATLLTSRRASSSSEERTKPTSSTGLLALPPSAGSLLNLGLGIENDNMSGPSHRRLRALHFLSRSRTRSNACRQGFEQYRLTRERPLAHHPS